MIEGVLQAICYGIGGIIWIYVVARVVTRAVLRTLDNRRKNDGEKE